MTTIETHQSETNEIDGMVESTQKEMLKKFEVLKKNGYDVKNYRQPGSLSYSSSSAM